MMRHAGPAPHARQETRRPEPWSYSAGERGVNRVRAFAHHETGRLFLQFYEPRGQGKPPRRQRVALKHYDRQAAKAAAEELATQLRAAGTTRPRGPVTLGTLFDIYLREVTPTKAAQTQQHDRQCVTLFLQAFGDRPALQLSRREWDRFIRDRRTGVLVARTREGHVGVRDRAIAYDLRFLLAVLNWATLSSDGAGGVLLDRNPLKGLTLPREESPRRPVLDDAQYQQLLGVAGDVDPLFRLALVLAHETGHRIGAIRLLRWSDVDLARLTLRWRGENDKIGHEHATPLTPAATRALEQERTRRPAIADAWIFASAANDGAPHSRHVLSGWWLLGVERAQLELPARTGWHSLRRLFANELRATPLKDLCALGGWKDPQTILTCYQQPDEGVMRAALATRQPRRSGVSA